MTRSYINAISLLVALTGMIYELSLAQILAAVFGGTLICYALTIGLFTASLGISSFIFDSWIKKKNQTQVFVDIQMIQAWLGIVSLPFILLAKKNILQFCFFPIILVGLLSGLELPILMSCASEENKNLALGFDYLGMFLATILFPLLLLPQFGVISTLTFVGLINSFIGLWFGYKNTSIKKWHIISITLSVLLSALILSHQQEITNYATQAFI
jgi:spermidine synthase